VLVLVEDNNKQMLIIIQLQIQVIDQMILEVEIVSNLLLEEDIHGVIRNK
jgi:hypothetical protein